MPDDLEGWTREDGGRQEREYREWPSEAAWIPDEGRTTGRPAADERSVDLTRDHLGVDYRDGGGRRPAERGDWAPNDLTARTGAHDDRPPGGWARHDRAPDPRDVRGWADDRVDERAGARSFDGDLFDDGTRVDDMAHADRYSREAYNRYDRTRYGRPGDHERREDRRANSLFDDKPRRPADDLDGQDGDDWARDDRNREYGEDNEYNNDSGDEYGESGFGKGAYVDARFPDAAEHDEDGSGVERDDEVRVEPERVSDGDPAAEALGTMLAEFADRRRATQEAAAAAEAAAAEAAERASAAIAEAARAAEEAEAAADAAARAADEAAEAADAERRAIAAAGDRLPPLDPGRRPGPAGPDSEPHTTRVTVGPQLTGRPVPPPGPAPQGPYPGPPVPRHHGPPPQLGPPGAGQSGAWRRPPGPPGPHGGPRGWLPGEATAGMPPGGGRAARRRAAESGGMAGGDPDSTEVLGLHALREPREAQRPSRQTPDSAEVTAVTRVRGGSNRGDSDAPKDADRRSGRADGGPDIDADVEADRGADDESEPALPASRLPARPVLAAIAVVAALAVVAVVAVVTNSDATPQSSPAAQTAAPTATAAPATSAPPAPPDAPPADPRSPQAVAYLTALRDADVPTSRSGQAETEAAAVICQQLSQGSDEATLVRTLPAVLPDLTRAQAAHVVESAQEHYC